MALLLAPLYALELGATTEVIGLLVAAAFVIPLFLAIPVGAIVDRVPHKAMLIPAAAILAAAPLPVITFMSTTGLAFTQVLLGISHLVLVVASQAYVASVGSGKQHEANFGWYTMFMSGGQLAGPIVAGVASDELSFLAAYALVATVGLLALIGFLPFRFTQVHRSAQASGFAWQKLRHLAGVSGFRVGVLVSFCVLFALTAYLTFFPLHLAALGYSTATIGLIIGVRALASTVVRPFMPLIITALSGRQATMLVTVVCVMLAISLAGTASALWAVVAISVLVGVGVGISLPLAIVAVADHQHAEVRGAALGIQVTANRSAQALCPATLGLVAGALGLAAAFFASGMLLLACAGLLIGWLLPAARSGAAPEAHNVPGSLNRPPKLTGAPDEPHKEIHEDRTAP